MVNATPTSEAWNHTLYLVNKNRLVLDIYPLYILIKVTKMAT